MAEGCKVAAGREITSAGTMILCLSGGNLEHVCGLEIDTYFLLIDVHIKA